MTQRHRSPLISPTAGLRLVWAVIRFFLVSYAMLFGKAARRIGAATRSHTSGSRHGLRPEGPVAARRNRTSPRAPERRPA